MSENGSKSVKMSVDHPLTGGPWISDMVCSGLDRETFVLNSRISSMSHKSRKNWCKTT